MKSQELLIETLNNFSARYTGVFTSPIDGEVLMDITKNEILSGKYDILFGGSSADK
jgi:hypothetical protein